MGTLGAALLLAAAALPLAAAQQVLGGACLPGCAATWKKCGRSQSGFFRACCDTADVCLSRNMYYSQCRKRERSTASFAPEDERRCTTTLGLSKENPLVGPLSLEELGAKPPPAGAGEEPLVKPYWLNMSDPLAANCSACAEQPQYARQANEPMFLYTHLCFGPSPKGRRARVRTKRNDEDGPVDTTLFVINEARSVTVWDDAGYLVCSDGSEPTPPCGDSSCPKDHDRCPPGTRLWSLSEVHLDLPPGSVPQCFQAAIGTKEGAPKVAEVGLDVLVDYEEVHVLDAHT